MARLDWVRAPLGAHHLAGVAGRDRAHRDLGMVRHDAAAVRPLSGRDGTRSPEPHAFHPGGLSDPADPGRSRPGLGAETGAGIAPSRVAYPACPASALTPLLSCRRRA